MPHRPAEIVLAIDSPKLGIDLPCALNIVKTIIDIVERNRLAVVVDLLFDMWRLEFLCQCSKAFIAWPQQSARQCHRIEEADFMGVGLLASHELSIHANRL